MYCMTINIIIILTKFSFDKTKDENIVSENDNITRL